MENRTSDNPTPYAVICRTHGRVYLTEKEYLRQLYNVNSNWHCPNCFKDAIWDDLNYERAKEN